jgi:hypothetical protein
MVTMRRALAALSCLASAAGACRDQFDVLDGGLDGGLCRPDHCCLGVAPSELDFGKVTVGTTVTSTFDIANLGPGECLVTGFNLSGCPPAFILPNGPVVSQRLSAPGSDGGFPTQLAVPVSFTPPDAGTFTCGIGPNGPSMSGVGIY